MPTTALPETTIPSRYSTTGDAIVMTAADVANGNHIDKSRNVILVAQNSGGSAYTVSITSAPDPITGRTGDVSGQSLAAGELRVFALTSSGWIDSNGHYLVSANNAAIKFGWFEA